jgi:hypothetical protein
VDTTKLATSLIPHSRTSEGRDRPTTTLWVACLVATSISSRATVHVRQLMIVLDDVFKRIVAIDLTMAAACRFVPPAVEA